MTGINALNSVQSKFLEQVKEATNNKSLSAASVNANGQDFDSVFKAAMDMVNETNELQNVAESEEIKFALGYSDSIVDLQVAQEKANTALTYTIAVRDKFLEAYKEIMNMQM